MPSKFNKKFRLKIVIFALNLVITSVQATESFPVPAENEFLELSLEELAQVDVYTVTASKIRENIDKSIAKKI